MDFAEMKQKNTWAKANHRNPWMGLDGVVCERPAYWCRLHEVWLSEEDVAKKKCLSKLTYNMMETYQCKCLERKSDNPFLKRRSEDGK